MLYIDMPELPEVETIKSQIEEITPFTILSEEYSSVVSSILKDKNKHFEVTGHTVSKMGRKGKLLYFELDDDMYILSHLGMSGSWRISKTKVIEKHTHVQFEVKGKKGNKFFIAYVDPRRFGNMYFVYEEEAKKHFNELGVDIGSPEFTSDYIYEVLKKHSSKVLKPFLLDQKYFAGCGNYIASEICARAGIRPTRKCGKVTRSEADKIREATESVLKGSIENNGMTFSGGYSDTRGEKGEGVQNLVVFYQDVCGLCRTTKVKKITLAQRGTYYCPTCQK
ncbi:MAG: Fpg/Nei family DNA glycosylase [Deltaproteobacteria bacterium]|nr:MAG: Fpg/Nei family DNA glycosylase [Deltaproteobacteria bacterium]